MKNKFISFFTLLLALVVSGSACVFAASAADETNVLNVHVTSDFFDGCDITVKESTSQLRVTFELLANMDIEQVDFRMNYNSTVLSPASDENSAALSCPNLSGIIFNPACKPSDEYADNSDMLSVAAAATNFKRLMDFSSEKKVFVTVLFDIVDFSAGETDIDLVVRDLYFKPKGSAAAVGSTRVVYLSNIDSELAGSIVIDADSSAQEILGESTATVSSEALQASTSAQTTTAAVSESEETTASVIAESEETTASVTAESEETTASAVTESEEITVSTEAESSEASASTVTKCSETTVLPSASAASAPNYAYGDVNRDGRVDITDATLTQKFIAGISEFDGEQQVLANVLADDVINAKDVTEIQKYIAKITAALPTYPTD